LTLSPWNWGARTESSAFETAFEFAGRDDESPTIEEKDNEEVDKANHDGQTEALFTRDIHEDKPLW
jgi:hypothetical protein